MKNIIAFAILALIITLSGCKKDEQGGSGLIVLNGATSLKGVRATSDLAHLNWIVKNLWELKGPGFGKDFDYRPEERDTINGRFFFFGEDAIGGINADKDGLGYFLSKAKNVVFIVGLDSDGNIRGKWSETDHKFMKNPDAKLIIDTVAYIPNAVIEKTRREVLEALKAGDNQRCYELFDKAIVFIPITGAEYRELEARGEN